MSSIDGIETTEFQQVQGIISLHRSKALQTVNNENLLTHGKLELLYLLDLGILLGGVKQ